MWRFRFGDPVTSAQVATVEASAAQVTAAGLNVLLDEWGGSKEATWAGLTGPQADNARVWIDVQVSGAWQPVFSGVLTQRPSLPLGQRTALGDKYHRLKWVPVERRASTPSDQERAAGVVSLDLGHAVRTLGVEAQVNLPHLVVNAGAVPDAGVNVNREYRGESMAAALDALVAAKPGWGWTTLPDDRVYLGPTVPRVAALTMGVNQVRVDLRDVNTEGTLNAIVWIWTLGDGRQVRYESRDASVATMGRYAATRYIDQRSAPAIILNGAARHVEGFTGGQEQDLFALGVTAVRDGNQSSGVGIPAYERVTLDEPADWVEVAVRIPQANLQAVVTYPGGPSGGDTLSGVGVHALYLPTLPAGSDVRVTQPSSAGTDAILLTELNPRRLNRALLDAAATDLYHVPPAHAATASELGLQPPAGAVVITRPGLPSITERVVGTRYVIAQPIRTEYVIGEPDLSTDARALRVLVDGKDVKSVDLAVQAAAPR